MKQLLKNTFLERLGGKTRPLFGTLIITSFLMVLGAGFVMAAQSEESDDYDYSAQSLRTSLWLDKEDDEVYRKGENQTVGFQTNEDAYAVIYRVDTEGLVTVLWPRSRYDDGFVFGGHEYLLPVSGSNRLRVASLEGEGFVEALVSRYAFDLRDLAIDFHHERGGDTFDFYVAGDPFLALNEINYAVTGLEESADYVITNYRSYYVHQKVEHPRYLCVQCHDDAEVAYDPYHDSCTLDISYDYGWYNDWYGRYGYYPIYSQPVYVYVDPWGWNPWVNFWYTPYYACAPTPYYSWGYSSYCWNDSPYYYGDSNVRYKNSGGRYRPLGKTDQHRGGDARSYEHVTRMVRGKPSTDVRNAMRNKTPVAGVRNGGVRADGGGVGRETQVQFSDTRFHGDKPVERPRNNYDTSASRKGQSGLRLITPAYKEGSRSRADGNRHVSSGADGQRRTVGSPAGISRTHIDRGSASSGLPASIGGSYAAPNRQNIRSNSAIRPVEPRQKGTRVWNNNRRNESANQGDKPAQVRPNRRENDGSRTGKQPERIKPRSGSSSTVKKQPKKTSSGTSRKPATSSSKSSSKSSSSKNRSSSVKKSSSSSSGSSATKSSGGSSRSSGSRSSGSRSSGSKTNQRR